MSNTFEKAWATVKGSPVPSWAQNPGKYRNTRLNRWGSGRGSLNESEGEFTERSIPYSETSGLRGVATRANTEDRREALDELGERPFFGGKKYDRKLDRIWAKRPPTDFRAERMTHDTTTGSETAENPIEDVTNPFFRPNND